MESKDYWQLFLETGAPECYLAFLSCKRTEENHVSECPGTGAPPDGVQ